MASKSVGIFVILLLLHSEVIALNLRLHAWEQLEKTDSGRAPGQVAFNHLVAHPNLPSLHAFPGQVVTQPPAPHRTEETLLRKEGQSLTRTLSAAVAHPDDLVVHSLSSREGDKLTLLVVVHS